MIKVFALVITMAAVNFSCFADEVLRIAVASNFASPMRAIVAIYQQSSSQEVKLALASTGKLYAQIRHGAPFDLFFSADEQRPKLLIEQGFAQANSRFTYAHGHIALLLNTRLRQLVPSITIDSLPWQQIKRVAIANSRLAPYGVAAEQTIAHYQWQERLAGKLIKTENINQTFNYLTTGHADLALVALSQVKQAAYRLNYDYLALSPQSYQVIKQQAVVLTDNPTAGEFIDFYQSSTQVKQILTQYGYH